MDAAILHALKSGSKPKVKAKPLKEFHAKEQNDGKYHVVTHSGKPNDPTQENTANTLDEVHQALEQHLAPDEGGADSEAVGEGQPAMGGETA
jgi:hypothetical protein